MDFSLTDSQQEIARLAGQLLDEGKADPWKELARSGLLALSLPADLPLRDDILISAFAVVAFSVIVQGLTAPFACARSD